MKQISFILLLFFIICLLPITGHGADETVVIATFPYVSDSAGLLNQAQLSTLNNRAEEISRKYQTEVRIFTVENMRTYGYSDIEKFSYDTYLKYDFGYGPEKNTVLLLLSMHDRDYDFRVWGSSKTAFTSHGINTLLDRHVLPLLRDDNYYQAFSIYLDTSEEYLRMAKDGTPFDKNTDPARQRNLFFIKIAAIIFIPLIIAFGVCTSWKSKMKTVKLAKTACDYIPESGFKLTGQGDVFLYRTTTSVKIEKNSSIGGGGAGGGLGGSVGRSGKF